MTKKQLVLIGGGHAHMVTLANLRSFIEKGYGVTVIQPSDFHYYSGMGPGMLSQTYRTEEIRFATRELVEQQGGVFVKDSAVEIDAENRRVYLAEDSDPIPYDVLSCNAGSQVASKQILADNQTVFAVKPIEKLLTAQQRILELSAQGPIRVGVIGGGPSAIEIAGNVWRLGQDAAAHPPQITIFAGRDIMPQSPQRVRKLAATSMEQRDITIISGHYVNKVEDGTIQLDNNHSYQADLTFSAVGVQPSPLFTASKLPTAPDGGLTVNPHLQCTSFPNIFGGGDCIHFADHPLDKVGVYAVRQNPILFHNLMAAMDGSALETFSPGGKYLLVYNLGDGTGILSKWSLTFGGRIAFRIKDSIDRRFMRTFQR